MLLNKFLNVAISHVRAFFNMTPVKNMKSTDKKALSQNVKINLHIIHKFAHLFYVII